MRNRKNASNPEDGELPLEQYTRSAERKSKKAGRGVNANYLLNISFAERETIHDDEDNHVYNDQSESIPYSKARFLNANCRFIIRPTGHGDQKVLEPDECCAWEEIEQLVRQSTHPTCPVCLSTPTAARVAPCGHVFCFPCMVRYFELGEDRWRECPICWDSLSLDDLRCVRLLSGEAPMIGKKVDMSLIHRSCESMLALPYACPDTRLPSTRTPEALIFARCMTACPTYLETEYLRDQQELENALAEAQKAEEWEEISSLCSALELVKQKVTEIQQQKTGHSSTHKSRHHRSHHAKEKRSGAEDATKLTEHGKTTTEYHFLQASDGQYVFLMPLDMRILKHEYGGFADFPSRLTLPVMSVEETTITKETRKKYKYLGHLPLGCDIILVATDPSAVVSKETLETFQHELTWRKAHTKENIPAAVLEDEEASLAYALQLSAALHGNGD